jgi:hypothetical protein
MWEEKGACPFTPKKSGASFFLIVIFCIFENLKGEELGEKNKNKIGEKPLEGMEKIKL